MAIKFCQIIDVRFNPGSQEELKATLMQRIAKIAESLATLGVEFWYGNPRLLDWERGEFQWRIDCVAIKPAALLWDRVYETINGINAVAYDKITDAHAANLIVGMHSIGHQEPIIDKYKSLVELGFKVNPSGRFPEHYQWQLNMVHNGVAFPPCIRPQYFATQDLAWADAQAFQDQRTVEKAVTPSNPLVCHVQPGEKDMVLQLALRNLIELLSDPCSADRAHNPEQADRLIVVAQQLLNDSSRKMAPVEVT